MSDLMMTIFFVILLAWLLLAVDGEKSNFDKIDKILDSKYQEVVDKEDE